jgi:hypothetical protein
MKKGLLAAGAALVVAAVYAAGGFDVYGYNYDAGLFVGNADGVDRNLDGMLYGDTTYANDRLVMKWSKAWDDARFHGADWTRDAWVDNEWNGNVAGGTGYTEQVKIVWVGPALQNSPYWRPGADPIWGEFEILMDHGHGPERATHGTRTRYQAATATSLSSVR